MAKGIALIYDVNNLESFNAIRNKWMKNIVLHKKNNARMILLGNKIDLNNE